MLGLRLRAAFEDFVAATKTHKEVKRSLKTFVEVSAEYQKRTGYQCFWGWPGMDTALQTLKSPKIDALMEEQEFIREIMLDRGTPKPGGPYHNRYSDGFMKIETSLPSLIAAMQEALAAM